MPTVYTEFSHKSGCRAAGESPAAKAGKGEQNQHRHKRVAVGQVVVGLALKRLESLGRRTGIKQSACSRFRPALAVY
jgi:hypothetical protein